MKHLAAFWATLLMLMASCGGDDGLGPATATDVADQDQDETKSPVDDNYEYQLPVIFHVLYQDKDDATQYLPDQSSAHCNANLSAEPAPQIRIFLIVAQILCFVQLKVVIM